MQNKNEKCPANLKVLEVGLTTLESSFWRHLWNFSFQSKALHKVQGRRVAFRDLAGLVPRLPSPLLL